MRNFIALSVRRPVSVIMAAIAVVAFGWVALQRLPLELLPDISYPSLVIQTEFPDTAPQEVENLVTRPIEEAVGVLRGLTTIHSVSRAGMSEVTLEFDWGSDMSMLSLEVREKLDRLILPDEVLDPLVLRYDPSLDPIVRLSFSGEEDLTLLRRVAERQLKPDLETVPGIASAQVRGGWEEEIQVAVDQERLAALGLPLSRVRDTVGAGNLNLPGGALRGRDEQFLVRTINEYDDAAEIGDLVVSYQEGRIVRVRDVAEVTWGVKEREEITRTDGREAVTLSIYREGDANTVTVARALHDRLDQWRDDRLPPDTRIDVLFDQSVFIAQAISEVRDAAVLGGALAVIVLLLFLRHLRSTLIIGLSIPLSVVATFILMYQLDVSLNLMSLGGLTLGIGMLVDNSIVVLEAIARRRQQGLSLARAAVAGASEVGAAVTASTLTTVAVFLPIVFVEGVAGELFRDQALTVTFSLLASLVVAVSLIPMLSALGGGGRGGRAPGDVSEDAAVRAAARDRLFTLGRVSRGYDAFLAVALRRRLVTLLVAFLLFGASVWGALGLGVELIPELSEGEFFFEVELPEGASLEATDRVLTGMEAAVADIDGAALSYATVGSRTGAGGVTTNTRAENLGQINVVMADRADEAGELAAAERLRQVFAAIPDLAVKFGRPAYFTLKTPIEVQLFGEDLEELRDYSLTVARELEQVPGLVDVRSSLEAGNPELQVRFDRERLAALGLDMATLSQALQDRVQGAVPTRLREQDRQIDIRVRNRESDRASLEDVGSLVVPGPEGRDPASGHRGRRAAEGSAEIHRLQQQRAALIAAISAWRAQPGRGRGRRRTHPGRRAAGGPHRGARRPERGDGGSLRQSMRFALAAGGVPGLPGDGLHLRVASAIRSCAVHDSPGPGRRGDGAAVTGTTINVIVPDRRVMLVGIVVNNAIVLIDTDQPAAPRRRREARGHFARPATPPASHPDDDADHGAGPVAHGPGAGAGRRAALAPGDHRRGRPAAVDAAHAGGDPGGLHGGAVDGAPAGG